MAGVVMRRWHAVQIAVQMARFAKDKQANVAMTFGLLMIPLMGFVGSSVDYSRANSAKAELQSALDATALMLAKEAVSDTASQLQTNASAYFKAQFNRPETINISVSALYTTAGGSQLTVSASASEPTVFMGIFGYNAITINSTTTTKWGSSRLRVALVLDNTGSMAEYGKLGALQTATKNLLSQLQAAASSNGDVYVSIIPFAKDVNLGSSNYAASWIDWTDWDASNGSCSKWRQSTQSSCLANHGTWSSDNHSSWNGCMTDRGDPITMGATGPSAGNYDTNVVAPTASTTATLLPAEQYSACPQAAMGLSYDWPTMNTLVNNMVANGNTNQAIGLDLGWMSLIGGGPFAAPAMDPNYTYSQIIILLTDGLNTQDRWYTSQSSIDARQQMTCTNIKATGVILYTIQVNTDGDPTSTLLQNCASDSSKFYLLTSSNQIVTTFNTIGTNLSQLYLAK